MEQTKSTELNKPRTDSSDQKWEIQLYQLLFFETIRRRTNLESEKKTGIHKFMFNTEKKVQHEPHKSKYKYSMFMEFYIRS